MEKEYIELCQTEKVRGLFKDVFDENRALNASIGLNFYYVLELGDLFKKLMEIEDKRYGKEHNSPINRLGDLHYWWLMHRTIESVEHALLTYILNLLSGKSA